MKLKKVQILGFKSFADKTVIEFHEGITCIVGPNGCGKSNIGDAIRWVLGEQSAKAMRGGKMPDVIFAGASGKKALNFAEVTVVFSEVNGDLPLDYNEVAITRRLHRSGESEYFINKQGVRLKDIHSLFLDTGIGKNNISFFEQGKIDQMIQYSPEERRTIFEEAAGIVRFLQRKRESFRKLEEVNLNLSRVKDICNEVERQVVLLESQAEAANAFKKNKEQLEIFEKDHLVIRFNNYSKNHTDLKVKETEFLEKQKRLHSSKEQLNQALNEKKSASEILEKLYRNARDFFLIKQNEKELNAQTKLYSEKQLKDLEVNDQKMTEEVIMLKNKQFAYENELERLEKDKLITISQLQQAKDALKYADCEFQELDDELQGLRKAQTEAYRTKVNAFQKQASFQQEVKQLSYRLETNLEKKEQLEIREKNLKHIINEKESELKLKEETVYQFEKEINEAKDKCVNRSEALASAIKYTRKAKEIVDKKIAEFHEKSAKLKALLHLRQEFSGFSTGGKQLLKDSKDSKSPIYGFLKGLYEYVIPQEGCEKAVSTALKPYSQTLVVVSKENFKKILQFAHEKDLSDYSLICLEMLQLKESTSSFIAESALGAHLISFLTEAKDLESAFENSFKSQIASWDYSGWFIDAKGVFFSPGIKETSVFTREAEIRQLEKDLRTLSNLKEKADFELTEALGLEQIAKVEKETSENHLKACEIAAMEAKFSLQKANAEVGRIIQEITQLEEEVRGLVEYIQKIIKEREKISESFKLANNSLDQVQEDLSIIEQALQLKNSLFNDKRKVLHEANLEVQKLDIKLNKISHQHHVLEAQISETKRLIEGRENDLKINNFTKSKCLEDSQNADLQLSSITKDLEEAKEKASNLEIEQNELKKLVHSFEAELKNLSLVINEVESKIHQIGIQLAHVETGQNAILVEMQERYNINLAKIQSVTTLSLNQLEKEIQNLRKFLEQNQNINLGAIEECKKQKDRAQFLQVQITDLVNAQDELRMMIAELDQESRILFKNTFEEIRSNFKKNFQILFKGGEADLELLEAENILDAGVEISAKPPGKQMRSLSLLSGGEKCLTAMALLFAIFEVKSAPFCILDEIDAPLDDSNVDRFLNVVKQFIDKCQFIIVTHNKRTMALADRLYGVSMEEKGISKILFLEFSEKTTQLVGV